MTMMGVLMPITNLLLMTLPQILSAMQEDFNTSSVNVEYWECNKKLAAFSSEGVVRLEIPSEIAAYVVKISYWVATSVEGNVLYLYRTSITHIA